MLHTAGNEAVNTEMEQMWLKAAAHNTPAPKINMFIFICITCKNLPSSPSGSFGRTTDSHQEELFHYLRLRRSTY
jgi:hypothetical protein